jgi:hypothetical protein
MIYNLVNIDIPTYQRYISNLKSTNDNKKLPKKNIHHNYLIIIIIKLFLMVFNLKCKRVDQTIAT